jgi:class 3 adenylate cyclase
VEHEVSEPPPPSVARGFLFADLRGYSSWVERHGDHAAAVLLREYRAVVRQAVSEFDGSEVKTEGDSFYVVFGSPSVAVRCGLRILELAAASQGAAGGPIAVGIGVHAGETVATDEGYVGSVVNVAARVCAQAGAGELLVTDAVRSMTRTFLGVTFAPRGRKRLKGISEPIALYRVTPVGEGARVPPRRTVMRRWPVAAATAGILLALVASALIGGALVRETAGRPSRSPHAASRVSAQPSFTMTPPASTDPAFPTALEAGLLALVDEGSRRYCQRADPEDVPILATGLPIGPGGAPVNVRAEVRAAIECGLGGIIAPDRLWFWQLTSRGGQRGDPAATSLFDLGGRVGAPPGTCREERPAIETWTFGGTGGRLLCYVSGAGDAVVVWVYDDDEERWLYARAERDDGDMEALLDWWEDVGRFAAP